MSVSVDCRLRHNRIVGGSGRTN